MKEIIEQTMHGKKHPGDTKRRYTPPQITPLKPFRSTSSGVSDKWETHPQFTGPFPNPNSK
jgi:hypothetical protein